MVTDDPATDIEHADLSGGIQRERDDISPSVATRGDEAADAIHCEATERPRRVFVCIGYSCSEQKSRGILTEFKKQIERHTLKDRVDVYTSTCLSQCLRAPAVQVFPEGTLYCKILPRDVRTIVTEHLEENRVVEHFVHDPFSSISWNDEIDS